jgi:hypothetical protein
MNTGEIFRQKYGWTICTNCRKKVSSKEQRKDTSTVRPKFWMGIKMG